MAVQANVLPPDSRDPYLRWRLPSTCPDSMCLDKRDAVGTLILWMHDKVSYGYAEKEGYENKEGICKFLLYWGQKRSRYMNDLPLG